MILMGLKDIGALGEGRNEGPTFHWNEDLQTWWGAILTQNLNRKEKKMLGMAGLRKIPWYSDEPELADATGTGKVG